MIDSHSLAEYSSHVLSASSNGDLEQRLGLYRVFLKLYEHHRGLLDEILDLENTDDKWRARAAVRFVHGVVQGSQVHLITNLLKGKTQLLHQVQGIWVIGRDRSVALPVQDKRLSRRHGVIQYVKDEGFYLIDLNSTNGTFVNGEPIRHAALLKDGDQIRLGSLAFTFFLCHVCRKVDEVSPDLLEQINATRRSSLPAVDHPFSQDASFSSMAIDWDTPIPGNTEETSMFLIPPMPGHDLPAETSSPQLDGAQQSEILDRFLRR
ncbi:FHA domain-containing protein [Kovacikia minuta CCNUW1]|uniref:FHA domain-containing protein n=1 Tax=Kovacikia minuta TaxID=2931930 RepID=UPI001CCB87B1|nr:FHA domain-containing protein [Kovacikia minuta]UBF25228.1 FHA domain-containing protein [Kovacikia minuta CCNUW1]